MVNISKKIEIIVYSASGRVTAARRLDSMMLVMLVKSLWNNYDTMCILIG